MTIRVQEASEQAAQKLDDDVWLTSKQTKQVLKISDCQLMHLRLARKLHFRKEGNKFMYLISKQPEN
ncbi:hypothetical protein LMJ53_14175 [Rheinheimera sp. UJ51]|uniref:hypothetical protein n=1 Tax=Rheinheimera sp. UJ51 TaxID=2892446 RepID=UPI001E570FE6|nr:hypothetical protein [Rheinheimera sp. UJ51]MCC5452871.1 hypothetical protein [Rheinheimera sp. UJ51]